MAITRSQARLFAQLIAELEPRIRRGFSAIMEPELYRAEGVMANKWTIHDLQDVRNMREGGATYRKIGEKYGISVERARQIVHKSYRPKVMQEGEMQGLEARLVKILRDEGIDTIEALKAAFSKGGLIGIPGIGVKAVSDIDEFLKSK